MSTTPAVLPPHPDDLPRLVSYKDGTDRYVNLVGACHECGATTGIGAVSNYFPCVSERNPQGIVEFCRHAGACENRATVARRARQRALGLTCCWRSAAGDACKCPHPISRQEVAS